MGACLDQVFAVVKHDQELLSGHGPSECRHRGLTGLLVGFEIRGHHLSDEFGIAYRRQVDEYGAVHELACDLMGHLNRQSRLADPARSRESDEATRQDTGLDLAQLPDAPDQAGERVRDCRGLPG